MPISSWILLLGSAFAAGIANALAGGGTFLVFPALIFAGIPPVIANATSSVAVLPGGLASVWVYRRGVPARKFWTAVCAASVAGAGVGSELLLITPSARFSQLAPYLMLGAAAVFSFSGPLRRLAAAHSAGRIHMGALIAGQFAIGVYGGYFGAGMGVLMVVLFLVAARMDVQASAAVRIMCGTAVNAIAVTIFAVRGIVAWRLGVPMLLAAIVGGYWGAHAFQRLHPEHARRGVLVYAWATGIWLLVRSLK